MEYISGGLAIGACAVLFCTTVFGVMAQVKVIRLQIEIARKGAIIKYRDDRIRFLEQQHEDLSEAYITLSTREEADDDSF